MFIKNWMIIIGRDENVSPETSTVDPLPLMFSTSRPNLCEYFVSIQCFSKYVNKTCHDSYVGIGVV